MFETPPNRPRRPDIPNRLRAVMLHVPWYMFEGQCRLAQDCGVAPSTISRLVNNETSPTYYIARVVTDALSRRIGRPLDMRDIFSTDNSYPTPCVCNLVGTCHGCFPPEALDDEGNLTPEFRDLRPGDWCCYRPLITPPMQPTKPLSLISPS